jgi:hypothetical protein
MRWGGGKPSAARQGRTDSPKPLENPVAKTRRGRRGFSNPYPATCFNPLFYLDYQRFNSPQHTLAVNFNPPSPLAQAPP